MPELPEVETVVRQLAPLLPGRKIRSIKILHPDLIHGPPERFSQALRGARILDVGRRGKNILLILSGARVISVNLGMTGKLLFGPPGTRGPLATHLGVAFSLRPDGRLHYADTRRFGILRLFSAEEWARESDRLGPEPLDSSFTARGLRERLLRSRSPIRSWLLDQTKIAGIGNIYASEALFRAKIHPGRPARSLEPREALALLRGIRRVLREAITASGTTLRDYRSARGDPGGFGPSLRAYGRAGMHCPRCKTPIERIVFGNRSAFLCPKCQPKVPLSAS